MSNRDFEQRSDQGFERAEEEFDEEKWDKEHFEHWMDTVRANDVAVLRAVIFASGITAPLLSWTTPKRVAVVVWPLAIQSGQHIISAMARRDRLIGKVEQLRRFGIDPSG